MFMLSVEELDCSSKSIFLDVKGSSYELFIYEDEVVLEGPGILLDHYSSLLEALEAITANIKPTTAEEYFKPQES